MVDGFVAKSCLTLGIPRTVACQALLSMEFSRQDYWSGLPFPSPYTLKNASGCASAFWYLLLPNVCLAFLWGLWNWTKLSETATHLFPSKIHLLALFFVSSFGFFFFGSLLVNRSGTSKEERWKSTILQDPEGRITHNALDSLVEMSTAFNGTLMLGLFS